MRFMTIRYGPKWTLSTNGGLELLQMVLELDVGWCATEDAGPLRRVDCEIPHRLRRGTSIPYKGVKTSP